MTVPTPPTPPNIGNNKAWAVVAAGAVCVIVNWLLVTFAHVSPPSEVVQAAQTLITLAGVYYTPHGG